MVYELRREETGIWSILKSGEVLETFEPNQKERAQERFRELMKLAESVWLKEGWRVSKKGNENKNWDRFHVVVFKKNDKWTGMLTDNITGQSVNAKREYPTSEEVKIAAFYAAISWEEKLNQKDE